MKEKPFINRKKDTEDLLKAVKNQSVIVKGDSGVGKTRLINETLTNKIDNHSDYINIKINSEVATEQDIFMNITETIDAFATEKDYKWQTFKWFIRMNRLNEFLSGKEFISLIISIIILIITTIIYKADLFSVLVPFTIFIILLLVTIFYLKRITRPTNNELANSSPVLYKDYILFYVKKNIDESRMTFMHIEDNTVSINGNVLELLYCLISKYSSHFKIIVETPKDIRINLDLTSIVIGRMSDVHIKEVLMQYLSYEQIDNTTGEGNIKKMIERYSAKLTIAELAVFYWVNYSIYGIYEKEMETIYETEIKEKGLVSMSVQSFRDILKKLIELKYIDRNVGVLKSLRSDQDNINLILMSTIRKKVFDYNLDRNSDNSRKTALYLACYVDKEYFNAEVSKYPKWLENEYTNEDIKKLIKVYIRNIKINYKDYTNTILTLIKICLNYGIIDITYNELPNLNNELYNNIRESKDYKILNIISLARSNKYDECLIQINEILNNCDIDDSDILIATTIKEMCNKQYVKDGFNCTENTSFFSIYNNDEYKKLDQFSWYLIFHAERYRQEKRLELFDEAYDVAKKHSNYVYASYALTNKCVIEAKENRRELNEIIITLEREYKKLKEKRVLKSTQVICNNLSIMNVLAGKKEKASFDNLHSIYQDPYNIFLKFVSLINMIYICYNSKQPHPNTEDVLDMYNYVKSTQYTTQYFPVRIVRRLEYNMICLYYKLNMHDKAEETTTNFQNLLDCKLDSDIEIPNQQSKPVYQYDINWDNYFSL